MLFNEEQKLFCVKKLHGTTSRNEKVGPIVLNGSAFSNQEVSNDVAAKRTKIFSGIRVLICVSIFSALSLVGRSSLSQIQQDVWHGSSKPSPQGYQDAYQGFSCELSLSVCLSSSVILAVFIVSFTFTLPHLSIHIHTYTPVHTRTHTRHTHS